MKKILLIFLIILVLFAVCFLLVIGTRQYIPLIDGVFFGMSPKQAANVLGESCEVEYDAGSTGKNAYTYKTDVLGENATVVCYFLNDKKLTQVQIYWETDPANLHKQAYTHLYDHYHNNKSFFEKKDETNKEEKHTSIGIDNGQTGIFYDIYETSTSLSISCVDLS